MDRAGVMMSTLCAIHCLAGAVLAGVSSVAPVLSDRRLELAFTVSAIAIAFVALIRAARRHKSRTPAMIAALGVASLVLARVGVVDAEALEVTLSIAGGVLLVSAHVINLRECRRVDSCCAVATTRG
jgi:hypothetical protein